MCNNTICVIDRLNGETLFTHTCHGNTIAKTVSEACKMGVSLKYAYLCGAKLRDLNLPRIDLRCADLSGADLAGTDLRSANLRDAILSGADLRRANLRRVELRGARLDGINAHEARGLYYACPTEGEFIGWKKAGPFVVKLLIPADALRSSATDTKCRCSKAFVMDIQNCDGSSTNVISVASNHDPMFKYVRNSWVEVKDFDTDRWNECTSGIHFFVDRREAEDWM